MRLEASRDPGGGIIGWFLDDEYGRRLWCGELRRADFLRLPACQRDGLRDDLGWYLVEINTDQCEARRVLARVSDESSGLRLARAYLRGCDADEALADWGLSA